MSKNGRELPSRERGPPFYVAVNHVAVNHVNPVIRQGFADTVFPFDFQDCGRFTSLEFLQQDVIG